ncbi:3904_t:CDS:2 [Diversispora eburnea]|uniref:3904_t:CDS:1 n=1 Tax=Diversispora eburnea TaxID=1213867 RepID=A0A9N8ZSF4_9GLOM|nr:3904_t:CDS:2 [Diversispora eburnea]
MLWSSLSYIPLLAEYGYFRFFVLAWSSGDKMLYNLLALRLRHMGYVVVVPNYSLYPKVKINGMLSDVKRALIWTEKYIKQYMWESQRGVEEVSALGRVMVSLLSNVVKNNDVDVDQLRDLLPSKILLIHGDRDSTVPLEQSLMFSPFKNKFTPHLDSELRNFMVNYDENYHYFDYIDDDEYLAC